MSRRRSLSTEISTDAKLARVSLLAALLYTWMLPHANNDRFIPKSQDALELLGLVMPLRRDVTEQDIEAAVQELLDGGLLLREEEDGLLSYPESFYKYQSIIEHGKRRYTQQHQTAPNSTERHATAPNDTKGHATAPKDTKGLVPDLTVPDLTLPKTDTKSVSVLASAHRRLLEEYTPTRTSLDGRSLQRLGNVIETMNPDLVDQALEVAIAKAAEKNMANPAGCIGILANLTDVEINGEDNDDDDWD